MSHHQPGSSAAFFNVVHNCSDFVSVLSWALSVEFSLQVKGTLLQDLLVAVSEKDNWGSFPNQKETSNCLTHLRELSLPSAKGAGSSLSNKSVFVSTPHVSIIVVFNLWSLTQSWNTAANYVSASVVCQSGRFKATLWRNWHFVWFGAPHSSWVQHRIHILVTCMKLHSAETSDGGTEWMWQIHHSHHYKTLSHQNDFEAVILMSNFQFSIRKWYTWHGDVTLVCMETLVLCIPRWGDVF